jgi:hypothetical protein
VRASFIILGFDFDACSSVVPLVVLSNILSEEVWDVSRVGLELSNPKFRVLLRKSRCALHSFFGFDFDGTSSVVVSLGVLVSNIFV